MDALISFFGSGSVALSVITLAIVAAAGIAVGSVRIYGIRLGIGGVLFTGLLAGYLLRGHSESISHEVLHFVREFGLILFVYAVGIQVGPGFFGSLRRQGLPLNLMAASIVLLGVVVTIGINKLANIPMPTAVGLFSGATTNTPSLGASQQALKERYRDDPNVAEISTQPTVSYAIAYPFGIIGIIAAMLITRGIFRIDLKQETEALARLRAESTPRLQTINLEVKNPNLDGVAIRDIPTLADSGVVISRVRRGGGDISVARPDMPVRVGDVLLAVGPPDKLAPLRLVVGEESPVDLKSVPSKITSRRIVITHNAVLGRTVRELHLPERFGVTITRIHRAEVEIPPQNTKLQFGDNAVIVGEEAGIEAAGRELGNVPKRLDHPQIIPIFVGIALGVLLGSIAIPLPGVPVPVKLGLAGGPLIVAIALSRLGNIGPVVWYMPLSANFVLRELGIVLFLACVGIMGGERFVDALVQGYGFTWMAYGALITFVPLMLVAVFGRILYKVNYLNLCGLLSGSMTDPPALAFASQVTGSDAPSVAYATVYPLTMLLRVLTAQIMALLFV
jgi:putative transport protein